MIMHTLKLTHTHTHPRIMKNGHMLSACAGSLMRAFASVNSVNDHRGAVSM